MLYINKIIGLKKELSVREWCNEDNLKAVVLDFGEYTIVGPIFLINQK